MVPRVLFFSIYYPNFHDLQLIFYLQTFLLNLDFGVLNYVCRKISKFV